MKIEKNLLTDVLADIVTYASITGYQLGDEEFVTILEFTEPEDALRFMACLAMHLRRTETHSSVLASVAAVETFSRKGRTTVRFRGWELT